MSLSEQNRLRLLDLASSLGNSDICDSAMTSAINVSIASLARNRSNGPESADQGTEFIPTCFKDDLDKLRQAEGASWGEAEIRLLAESLRELGNAVDLDLKPFIH